MMPDRWRQLENLYHAALELEESRRAAFLDQACAGDQALRREVESLLAYNSRAENFIESTAIEIAANLIAKDQTNSIVGQTIGPYQVISLIGAGGMGVVYLAEDSRLGRKIVLKLLPEAFTQDPDRVRRFEQEARAASALNHPNIITIFEVGQADDAHYIATEYVDGHTLRQQIMRGRIELRESLDIACQIASALSAAHEAGIVHRDIKPENIMLRPDGIVKVLDFGLAKLVERRTIAENAALDLSTSPGIVLGTVYYMSPEQLRAQKVDARSDLFSLGVVLYEMAAGCAPFRGDTSADVIAAIINQEPPLADLAPETQATLGPIVTKALSKDRKSRYQTARELLADLKSLKHRLEFEEELLFSVRNNQPATEPAPGARWQSRQVIDSLAILPIINNCGDPGMDYFSDGITESIINTLSQLAELRVMAWSTVSRYKGRWSDPREVGRDLGVRAVLNGRLIQHGENLIFKTELVDTSDGSHLWSDSSSCKPSDIFQVEAEICREISEKLLLRLTTEERKRLAKRYTDNTEAYHAYLKGRHFWNKRTDESVRQGIEYFKRAIDTDPSYALAYAGLADSYIILGSFGIATLAPGEAYPKAREAAMKALEIDDTLAEAHTSLGFALAQYCWDWAAAEREFKRSIDLKPGYATAHHWYGFIYLVAMGLLDEALIEVKRAHELDPLSLSITTDLGLLLYLARQYDRAIDQYQKTLEMDQNFVYSHWKLGLAYEQMGKYEEAIADLEKAIALYGRSTLPLSLLGHTYAVSGKREEALEVLDQLNELSKLRYVSSYRTAAIHAGLGEKDQAFEWLERAYRERDGWLVWLKADPVVDPLRSDGRFKNLLRRISLGSVPQADQTLTRNVAALASRTASSRKRPLRKAIASLAILPLVNTSDDPAMEYLSDGITESIINTLSQLPKTKVVARSTVFRYKGLEVDPQEIGRRLGVQAVLTGRVRQVAERLAIAVELIDVASESQLWGEHYSRNLSDLLEIEEDIAREITEKLRLKLNRNEKARITKRHTENVEAYQAYLKGRYFWNKRTSESLSKGIDYFKQAIDRDPAYALAYAGLSDSYTLLVIREALPPDEGFSKAKAAAGRALEIDGALAEAHAARAHARLHNWEWEDSEKGFKRAIALNPNYASAHHWYSEYLMATGQMDEAIAEVKRAKDIDPLSLIINVHLSDVLYFARKYDESIEQCQKSLELESNFFLARLNLGRAYAQMKMYEKGLAEINKARELMGDSLESAWLIGEIYAASGKEDEARRLIEQLNEQSKHRYVSQTGMAMIHAALGENDRAFECLERAYRLRDGELFNLKVEPKFDPLRPDARFQNLLHRMGLGALETRGDREPETVSDQSISRAMLNGIAVLPFRPISAGQRDQYLELGIADALITKLTNLNRIVVRPTSAVRKYAGAEQDPLAAGRKLRVESVLEGGIQKLGDRIRVTAQLVRVSDGRSLWAGQFDEKLTDIFAVEDSISERVTAALALKLTGEEKRRLTRHHTENVEAYQAYLKGRFFWNKRTTYWLKKSASYFQQAIDRDPCYALAYAGLADSYTLLVTWEALTPQDGFSKARAAARSALEIDESLAEAHAGLAHTLLHTWDWAESESEFKRAIDLSPGYASAHQWYAEYLAAMGRFDQSVAEIKRARELDPLSVNTYHDVGRMLYFARRYDEAIEQLKQTIEMEPGFWSPHHLLGQAYTQKAMYEEAIEEFQKAMELSGKGALSVVLVGHAYAASGKRGEALAIVDKLKELSEERYFSPYRVAMIYAGLGHKDQMFEWLERAYQKRDANLIWLKVDPVLDGFRYDSRFSNLLRRVGLAPPESQEKLAGAVYQRAVESDRAARQPTLKAVAVLPFKPISAEGRDHYLELGMADALITRLSNINQIVVRPTSAVRKYTELEVDSLAAGRELRVESVLEGCIQKLGDKMRVTARLLRVEDGAALWADKFDERFTDIFDVQDSISERVAAALALKLTGEERERLTKRYTENIEAYHLYLEGRYYWNKRAEEALHKSIHCFNQAIDTDPNYALAYAGLADAYTFLGDVGISAISPKEAFSKARAAAAKALEIDERLAEAHASLGHLNMHHFNWPEAEREFNRALELKPNYATAHQWYAYYLIFTGRADEALREIRRALEFDPLSQPINVDVGEILYYARRYDEAIEQFRKTLEIYPQYYRGRLYLARLYEQKQLHEEAIRELQKALSISGHNIETRASLAHAYALSGKKAEARELLEELNGLSKQHYVSPFDLALIHAELGEKDKAFELLEKAYDERAEWMIYLTVDPRLDGLRSDPRLAGLARRIGLAPHLHKTTRLIRG